MVVIDHHCEMPAHPPPLPPIHILHPEEEGSEASPHCVWVATLRVPVFLWTTETLLTSVLLFIETQPLGAHHPWTWAQTCQGPSLPVLAKKWGVWGLEGALARIHSTVLLAYSLRRSQPLPS